VWQLVSISSAAVLRSVEQVTYCAALFGHAECFLLLLVADGLCSFPTVASVVIIIRQVIVLCRDMFSSAIFASVSSVALSVDVHVHD
jgi:hypothetical protein